MATVVLDSLSVCPDCAGIAANGETGQGEEYDQQHVARMLEELGGYHLAGLVVTGEGSSFSRWPCDGCGDALAGDRLEAAVIR